jgi:GTP diphosphokinase / guanosine-3',5'-bis(diphosphate) 3'-diphosphatase
MTFLDKNPIQESGCIMSKLFSPEQKTGLEIGIKIYLQNFDYMSAAELAWLEAAYRFTESKFQGKFRDSGEPRFEHSKALSLMALHEFGIKPLAVHLTCLGHDLIEDTGTTYKEMQYVFGIEAASACWTLTIPNKSNGSKVNSEQREAYYCNLLRSNDSLVQIVSVLDSLHSLQTLGYCKPDRQQRIVLRVCKVSLPMIEHMGHIGVDGMKLLRAFADGMQRHFSTL